VFFFCVEGFYGGQVMLFREISLNLPSKKFKWRLNLKGSEFTILFSKCRMTVQKRYSGMQTSNHMYLVNPISHVLLFPWPNFFSVQLFRCLSPTDTQSFIHSLSFTVRRNLLHLSHSLSLNNNRPRSFNIS